MSPRPTMTDRAYDGLAKPVLQRQFGAASSRRANRSYICGRQFGLSDPPFSRRVLHVVVLCPGKQVRWVEATPVVARMADCPSYRCDTMEGGERHPVGGEQHALAVLPIAHLSVARLRVDGVRPLPACFDAAEGLRDGPHPTLRRAVFFDAAASDEGGAAALAANGDCPCHSVFSHASYYSESWGLLPRDERADRRPFVTTCRNAPMGQSYCGTDLGETNERRDSPCRRLCAGDEVRGR